MKQKLPLLVICIFIDIILSAQGAEFGYMFEIGDKSNFRIGQGYNQYIESEQHNLYLKFHKKEKKTSIQWILGFRKDSVYYSNYANYYSTENNSVEQYHNQGYFIRNAMRFEFSKFRNFGNPEKHFRLSAHYGLFYDATIFARRVSLNNTDTFYELKDVLRPRSLGFNSGIEASYRIFSIGCKLEKPFTDLINHEYIKSQTKNVTNASELQGLRLDSWRTYIYAGIHVNF